MRTKAYSYIQLGYDELQEGLRKKALRQVKREYRRILSDDAMLIRLIEEQRTSFHEDGSLYHLIPYQAMCVTGRSVKRSAEKERLTWIPEKRGNQYVEAGAQETQQSWLNSRRADMSRSTEKENNT